jgi:hypothetical protein
MFCLTLDLKVVTLAMEGSGSTEMMGGNFVITVSQQ